MFADYARYYLSFGLQLLTMTGLALGGPWAWLGVSSLFFFALVDELLPLTGGRWHLSAAIGAPGGCDADVGDPSRCVHTPPACVVLEPGGPDHG